MPVCNTAPHVILARKKGTSHLLFLGGSPGVAAHRMMISMIKPTQGQELGGQGRAATAQLLYPIGWERCRRDESRMATGMGKPPAYRWKYHQGSEGNSRNRQYCKDKFTGPRPRPGGVREAIEYRCLPEKAALSMCNNSFGYPQRAHGALESAEWLVFILVWPCTIFSLSS